MPGRLKQIEALALLLTIEYMMREHSYNHITALETLNHEVFRLSEQFPKVKRENKFKTHTLMKIVEQCEWSRTAEEEVMEN